MINLAIIQITKRDGVNEDWNKDKLLNSITHAGVSPQEVESVANLTEAWVEKNSQSGPIKSTDIRAKVIDILRAVDPKAAGAFETYKKPV